MCDLHQNWKETSKPPHSKGLANHVPSSFILLPHPSPLLSEPVYGERRAFLAVTAGLLVAATQLPGLNPIQLTW